MIKFEFPAKVSELGAMSKDSGEESFHQSWQSRTGARWGPDMELGLEERKAERMLE